MSPHPIASPTNAPTGEPVVWEPPPPVVVRVLKVVNPVLKPLLRCPLGGRILGRKLMLLRFTGRSSGQRYDVPISAHADDSGLYALTPFRWRRNFVGGKEAEVSLRGRTRRMHGVLVEDVAAVADTMHARITELGARRASRLIGLRFNEDRLPTHAEVTTMVRKQRFAVVRLNMAA